MLRVLLLRLRNYTFALPQEIFEVAQIRSVTVLPGTQEVLHGLTTLGGRNVPIVNLPRLLGLNQATATRTPQLAVIIQDEDCVVAFPVSEVLGMQDGLVAEPQYPAPMLSSVIIEGTEVELLHLQGLLKVMEDGLGLQAV